MRRPIAEQFRSFLEMVLGDHVACLSTWEMNRLRDTFYAGASAAMTESMDASVDEDEEAGDAHVVAIFADMNDYFGDNTRN